MQHTPVSTPSTVEDTRRRNNFDFLRFFLATTVVFGHSYSVVYGHNERDPISIITRGQMFSGTLAVYGFFIISGFLITRSWFGSRGLLDYTRRRVLRIYPGFIVVALFCIFVFAPLGAASASMYWRHLRPGTLFLPILALQLPALPPTLMTSPMPILNGSLWTVYYEFVCYILVAVLGITGLLRHKSAVLILYLLSLIVAWAYVLGLLPFLAHLTLPGLRLVAQKPEFLGYFLSGVLFAVYREQIPYSRRFITGAGLLLTVSCVIPHGLMFTLPFVGAYLLLRLAHTPSLRLHHWAKRGDFSYGIYLYAFPIQQLLLLYVPALRHPLLLFPAAMLVILPVAVLSWHLVEKPCLALKKARVPCPEPADTAISIMESRQGSRS